jgi:site-specific DNA recombinase
MLGSFIEFKRSIINKRTRNVRIARFKERFFGDKPALGYKVNENGEFEID